MKAVNEAIERKGERNKRIVIDSMEHWQNSEQLNFWWDGLLILNNNDSNQRMWDVYVLLELSTERDPYTELQ